jgi:large conductance mechanosensitive channel
MESKKSMIAEFTEFVQKYGVAGLAIGFVTGTAASDFVKIISENILTPIVAWIVGLFGKDAFNNLNVKVTDGVTLGFGNVISGLISFLAVMAFVFVIVKFVLNKMMSDADHKSV